MSSPGVSEAIREAAPQANARLRAEYAALTEGAGAIELPDPGILRVDGRDREAWLNNLVTTQVESMPVGSAAYSLLLEAKGHVVADFVLIRHAEFLLLYTSRTAHESLSTNLRRAIFREKVTLTDVSTHFGIISVQGPQAAKVISRSLNLPLPNRESPISDQEPFVIPNPRFSTRFDILAPRDSMRELERAVMRNRAAAISWEALDCVRVEAGVPQYGDDFDETTLAPEAGLDVFIAPNKGCYPGQETIARIRNRGHVNRLLVQAQIMGDEIPHAHDLILADGKEIGSITSAAWSFGRGTPLALGYTRREMAEPGTRIQIQSGSVRLNAEIAA